MNQKLHAGPHPDADQLSVFAEGADTVREREQMLAHLAQCRECRDVLFLMQRSVEPSAAAKEVPREWAWQRWLLPAGLTGAALVGLAVLLVYFRPSATVPESNRQNAAVEEPEIGATGKPLVPSGNAALSAQPDKAENGSGPGRTTMGAVRREPGGSADSTAPNVGNRSRSAGAATQGTETAVVSGSAAGAEAGAAPKPDAQSDVSSAAVQQLPLGGRNVMSLPSPATPPGAQATTPSDSLETQQNPPRLRVERQGGQDETLSGVSGRVTDMSGAVIPEATVALRDASGSTRQVATGADGSFRLTAVPAGHYDLTVTAPGFRNSQQSIDLKPSELTTLQPVLNPGAVTQGVTVTSSAPLVETESARVTSIVAELPIVSSVSLHKRVPLLDRAGSLFLSRNAGKKWKKVDPQWTGKAVRIDLIATERDEANGKSEASGAKSARSVFQLTTDSGTQWTSQDGTHWRPQ